MEEVSQTSTPVVETKPKRGKPFKYHSDEERKKAIRQQQREHYRRNHEKRLNQKREWASKNKDKIKIIGARRTENARKYKLLLKLNEGKDLFQTFPNVIKQMIIVNGTHQNNNSESKSELGGGNHSNNSETNV